MEHMKKPFYLYAVIWTKSAKNDYGAKSDFIFVEETKGSPALAIFEKKKEAEAYRNFNDDWKTIRLVLLKTT